METFITVRHGEQDPATLNLTQKGVKDAQKLGVALEEKYRGKKVSVFTSPSARCMQTATILGQVFNSKVRVESLLEINAEAVPGKSIRGQMHMGSIQLEKLEPLLVDLMPKFEVVIMVTHDLTTLGLIQVVCELAQGPITDFTTRAGYARANILEVETGEVVGDWFPVLVET